MSLLPSWKSYTYFSAMTAHPPRVGWPQPSRIRPHNESIEGCPVSPRRRALVVAAAVALVAVVATFALGRRAGPELTANAEVPVLLVPGYNDTPGSLGALAARLR